MCTITSVTNANWGNTVTVTGTGFGSAMGVGAAITITNTTGTAVTTPINPFAIGAWSDTQIQFTLPNPPPVSGDGAYRVAVTTGVGGTPCNGTATFTAASTTPITFTIAPSPATWGSQLALQTTGNFGPTGTVTLEKSGTVVNLTVDSWNALTILVTLPLTAPAGDGTYTVVVHRATDAPSATVAISSTGGTVTTTVAATPNPVAQGANVLLTAIGGSFGVVAGGVVLSSGGTPTAVSAPVWTASQIVATVLASLATGNYTVTVTRADGTTATGSVSVVAAGTVTSPVFIPDPTKLPNLSADPAFLFDGTNGLLPFTQLMQGAQKAAGRYRYEYLKALAVDAAKNASIFEGQILTLMQMAQSKVQAAEMLLNPTLIQAVGTLQSDAQSLEDLGQSADLQTIVGNVADAATTALLLEMLITWFVETDPIQFWIGLFSALIDDIAAFDTNVSRTRKYIHDQTQGKLLQGAMDLAKSLVATLDAKIDEFAAPLRAAVSDVVGGVSREMNDILKSTTFDEPLLQSLGAQGQADVPNVDPLQELGRELTNLVEDLIAQIKDAMTAILDYPDKLAQKLEDIIVAFFVLPILAILVVGLAAGPFGAALLAAAVLIAVQELAHLILSWLTGTLLDQLADAKKKVIQVAEDLKKLLAKEGTLIETTNPADYLKIGANEVRELKDLVPEAFLNWVAELLGAARDVMMNGAVKLALGAEQAIGLENGTAFDTIGYSYKTGLPQAQQLPGGSDPALFAGAALLRDLANLEQQRAGLLDGKDMEVTRRLSVLDMLGGDRARFLDVLRNGRLILQLTEEGLLDAQMPGLYRALIKEVRVTGLFDATTGSLPISLNLPVAVTHLGPSRTRIKKNGNPFAPPIALPAPLQDSSGFLRALGLVLTSRWHPPPGAGASPTPLGA